MHSSCVAARVAVNFNPCGSCAQREQRLQRLLSSQLREIWRVLRPPTPSNKTGEGWALQRALTHKPNELVFIFFTVFYFLLRLVSFMNLWLVWKDVSRGERAEGRNLHKYCVIWWKLEAIRSCLFWNWGEIAASSLLLFYSKTHSDQNHIFNMSLFCFFF